MYEELHEIGKHCVSRSIIILSSIGITTDNIFHFVQDSLPQTDSAYSIHNNLAAFPMSLLYFG